MSEWKSYLLKELGEFFGGVTSISKKDYGHGHPFLQYTNVYKNSKVDIGNLELMDVKESDLIKRNCLFGDIFFTASSEVEDEVAMSSVLLDEIENLTYNGFTKRYRLYNFDILSPYYARYLFRARSFRGEVYQRVNGDVRYNISQSSLGEIPIFLPPLEEQHAIASVLSSLDDKIDLLHRQNETLEKMAETLFRQWFVEEADEELEERPLSEYFQLLGGFAFKSKDYSDVGKYKVITIKGVQDGYLDSSSAARLEILHEKIKPHQILKTGDILMSLTGNVGRVCLVDEENCLLNQRVAKIEPNNRKWKTFAYFYFRQNEMIERLTYLSKGSAQLNLSPVETLAQTEHFPDDSLIDSYCELVNPLLSKIMTNKTQIRTLTALRDTLLPKLMSGEVRVNYE